MLQLPEYFCNTTVKFCFSCTSRQEAVAEGIITAIHLSGLLWIFVFQQLAAITLTWHSVQCFVAQKPCGGLLLAFRQAWGFRAAWRSVQLALPLLHKRQAAKEGRGQKGLAGDTLLAAWFRFCCCVWGGGRRVRDFVKLAYFQYVLDLYL